MEAGKAVSYYRLSLYNNHILPHISRGQDGRAVFGGHYMPDPSHPKSSKFLLRLAPSSVLKYLPCRTHGIL